MKKTLQKIVENQKIRIFLFFLVISTGSLLLNKLSKEYRTTVSFQVVADQIPSDKILLKQPEEWIKIKVKASGFNLIAYQILNRKIKMNASKSKLVQGTTYKIETSRLVDEMENQLLSNTEIIEIVDKTVFIDMGKMVSKKIPVILKSQISYENGYKMKGSIKLLPDSVLIFGPEDKIAKINQVETHPLIMNHVYDDFEEEINLQLTQELKAVYFDDTKITVTVSVEKFTELTFLVPFKIINNHKKLKIECFPSKVKLVFQVELSAISNINENSFEVVCDFENASKQQLNYLIPKLIKKPTSVHHFHIEPTKVDYIIKK
ncbi:MAG: hypothetical protein Q7U08_08180 [Flavobacteriaceae bacterium]|nr:hypothetical protein [Flavobacteriaceae bacterium]